MIKKIPKIFIVVCPHKKKYKEDDVVCSNCLRCLCYIIAELEDLALNKIVLDYFRKPAVIGICLLCDASDLCLNLKREKGQHGGGESGKV